MISPAEITFNVIFVPGTVRYLNVFTRSAIFHSECRFRLVSNGCGQVENQLLQELAAESPRVEFFEVDTRRPLRHGVLLDQLQRLEVSKTFAFMDSDIYATGRFLSLMLSEARNARAIFSCSPVWCNHEMEAAPSGCRLLKGFHNRLHDGFNVGSTYFAVYDNTVLSHLIRETGVSFEVCLWNDIPQHVRDEFVQRSCKFVRYDTGKVVNILLNLRGHQLRNVQTDELKHVGGVSLDALKNGQKKRRKFDALFHHARQLLLLPLSWLRNEAHATGSWHRQIEASELRRNAEVKRRRLRVSRYMSSMMLALSDRRPFRDDFRFDDPELAVAVQQMQQDVMTLFRRCGNSFRDEDELAA